MWGWLAVVAKANPSMWEEAVFCEFEASLVYILSPRDTQ